MGCTNAEAVAFAAAVSRFSESGDPTGLREELNRAVDAIGLGPCIDDVVMPALRRTGRRWRLGVCSIDTERLATEAVRGWLEALAVAAPEPRGAVRPVVLACGPSDRHTVALESLGVLLRYHRQSCRMLGSRATVRGVSSAVVVNRPRAVVVACHLSSTRPAAVELLREVAKLGPGLFYAGNGFESAAHRRHVPGTYLGNSLSRARDLIVDFSG